ncbi:MAG: hypothetical protein NVS9B4_18030 [Candidatus Acidiferrum sp.]
MSRREHTRARLSLPLRLRWSTPFGQKIELAESLDASRGGLRVVCGEGHEPGTTLWVTFPYDASLADGQPEMPARVMRCESLASNANKSAHGPDVNGAPREEVNKPAWGEGLGLPEQRKAGRKERRGIFRRFLGRRGAAGQPASAGAPGGNGTASLALALKFLAALPDASDRANHAPVRERRASPRRRLALPIHVRLEQVPWFEEAMTVDVSSEGLRFLSSREYQPGTHLLISFGSSSPSAAPWSGGKSGGRPGEKEFRLLIVRVELMSASPFLTVAALRPH